MAVTADEDSPGHVDQDRGGRSAILSDVIDAASMISEETGSKLEGNRQQHAMVAVAPMPGQHADQGSRSTPDQAKSSSPARLLWRSQGKIAEEFPRRRLLEPGPRAEPLEWQVETVAEDAKTEKMSRQARGRSPRAAYNRLEEKQAISAVKKREGTKPRPRTVSPKKIGAGQDEDDARGWRSAPSARRNARGLTRMIRPSRISTAERTSGK